MACVFYFVARAEGLSESSWAGSVDTVVESPGWARCVRKRGGKAVHCGFVHMLLSEAEGMLQEVCPPDLSWIDCMRGCPGWARRRVKKTWAVTAAFGPAFPDSDQPTKH